LTNGYSNAVAVSDHYAYVAEGGGFSVSGLRIFDIANPADPRFVGALDSLPNPEGPAGVGVAVSGKYAFLAKAGLQVIDVSDPANPQGVGSYTNAAQASSVLVSDQNIYLANGIGGLLILSRVPPPAQFEPAPAFTNGALTLHLRGPAGLTGRIERGTQLGVWTTWKSVTIETNQVDVTDPDTSSQTQFYRFVSP